MSTEKEDIIFLAGHKGLLGSAILKKLKRQELTPFGKLIVERGILISTV